MNLFRVFRVEHETGAGPYGWGPNPLGNRPCMGGGCQPMPMDEMVKLSKRGYRFGFVGVRQLHEWMEYRGTGWTYVELLFNHSYPLGWRINEYIIPPGCVYSDADQCVFDPRVAIACEPVPSVEYLIELSERTEPSAPHAVPAPRRTLSPQQEIEQWQSQAVNGASQLPAPDFGSLMESQSSSVQDVGWVTIPLPTST